MLSLEIDKLCFNLAVHIQKISEEKIKTDRMTLYLRVDSKGDLVLLFCSYMQYTDTTQMTPVTSVSSEFEPELKVVPEAYDASMLVVNKPASIGKSVVCSTCKVLISRLASRRPEKELRDYHGDDCQAP